MIYQRILSKRVFSKKVNRISECRHLDSFDNSDFNPGRGLAWRIVWYLTSLMIFESGLFPFSRPKASLLRLFGATCGRSVVIKPHVRIKYPWKLKVGSNTWIGQGVWIDNLDHVVIGSDVCISQGVYFCTGSHDYHRPSFDLITSPITVENGAWIACRATILGGAMIGSLAIVCAGGIVTQSVPEHAIVGGVPAKRVG